MRLIFKLLMAITIISIFFFTIQDKACASEILKKQAISSEKSACTKLENEVNSMEIFKEGYKVIETFYKYLLSDCDVKECPDIFLGCSSESARNTTQKRELLAQEWKYLRDNKKLFFKLNCDNELPQDASNFLNSYQTYKGYYFFNPPDVDHLTESKGLCIALETVGLAKGRLDGIYKLILFPIKRDEETKSCKIILLLVTINGVRLEQIYYGHFERESFYFDRDFNFFEGLGFDVNREIPEREKERLKRFRIEDCGVKENK